MKKLLPRLLGALGLAVFCFALWALHSELRHYHYHQIIDSARAIPTARLWTALILAAANYLLLTGYDILAFIYIRKPLPRSGIVFASFISNALGNNVGYSMVFGGSLRYRFYTAWGVGLLDVTRVILFTTVTLWLGMFTVAGIIFTFEPLAVPAAFHLPIATARPAGILFLLAVLTYLLLTLRDGNVKFRAWEFSLPRPRLALAQVLVASLDWMLAAAVLYVLLPDTVALSYLGFLGIFLLAQFVGIASQVPGGLGVFETIILLLLPGVAAPAAIGSLLLFRITYYLLPLCTALLLLGLYEFIRLKRRVLILSRLFDQWVPELVPRLLTFSTFAGGLLLLFSGATPAAHGRLALLEDFLPLPVMELSHFLGSLAGVWLLFLARGLQLRLDAAYHSAVLTLAAGIVLSLLKGFDYEEALILGVMLAALLPSRRYFYRKASLIGERLTAGWIIAIALAFLSSLWLGMFAFKHVEYSSDLWWHYSLRGDAPRFLRASVGAAGLLLFFSIARLLRPAKLRTAPADGAALEEIKPVVRGAERTYAHLALLGDKHFLLSEDRTAFIMYGVQGRSWIALGDPVGPEAEWPELLWRFREMSDLHAAKPVFYEIGHEHLPLYIDLGLTFFKFGEEAIVDLPAFSLEGGHRKRMRNHFNRIKSDGYAFEIVPPEDLRPLLPELKSISDDWLRDKKTREKGFSLGFFKEEYLLQGPVAVVRREGKVYAFANVLAGGGRGELSVDLMRFTAEAPNGVMDYLFINMMLYGKQEGYRRFNLGMVPMAGLENRSLAPLWGRTGALLYAYGENFYNFQGLRQYKEKFDPAWEPRYIASYGGVNAVRTFVDIAALVSRGLKGIITR